MSKNVPTNSSLYSRVKSEAKKKFDRWPSAYGSAWLVKEYKRRGGGYRKAEQGMEVSDEMFSGYNPADMDEYKLGGGIPERYKNMGFSKVGQKKESTRSGKKWMVLAKKGDKYKVVHGGYKGMKDFTQHGSEKRKDRFWDRMGGKDSAKAKDPFSPLYWHKRLGTWAEGGEPQNEGFQALPAEVQAKIMANMMYGGTMYAAGGEWFNEDSQDFYRDGGQWIQDARKSMEEKGTVGAFTEQARREGYDNTQEFASYVLDNPGQFTSTTKKRAQFAKNMGKLNKAMRGMELNKYQMQGQTIEELNWNANEPIRRQEALRRGEAYTPQPFEPKPTMLDEVTVYGRKIEPAINLPSKGLATVTPMNGDMTAERIDLPSKELAPIPVEMPKLGPMPTISLPQEQQAQSTDTQTVQVNKGFGYEAMGGKDDPWWQKNVAAVAYAPGIAANFIQSAIDNRTAAKGRKNYMTDYTDDVVRQGLALSRGDYEMNTDALDVTNRTPVQFGNYFEAGGETTIDETLLKDLIAAGADIEILE
jgi:hypothetical protein